MGANAEASCRDQYQHAIPRFILRHFQISPIMCINSRERKKVVRKAQKKGQELETIFYYDLTTGSLETPSISRSYGKMNLYRDSKNTDNVDHLECKLSGIENDAAAVIKTIQGGLTSGEFSISRLELATLRKFIFLMHYRHDTLSSTYFQESHPHNAPLADWIRNYKESRQLATDADVWRQGLRYYLDTPHQVIVTTAEKIRARYGDRQFHEMLRRGVDPALEEAWYAVDYESQANYFFLGVWEAAENTEFILGGNGFGLWEGLIYGSPGAHKIYVMSPRIAIVLRRTILHKAQANDPAALESCLADIAIYEPDIRYADSTIADKLAIDEWTLADMITYRCSAQAQKDIFTVPITKLSDAETYAVNEVVIMNANVHQAGSITFGSPTAMLKTLETYMSAHNTFVGGRKALFRPLLHELLAMNTEISPSSSPSSPLSCDIDYTDTDLQLNFMLRFVVKKGMEFNSLYNRAYFVYHMATDAESLSNSVSLKIRKIVEHGISKLGPLALAPTHSINNLSFTSSVGSQTTMTLVETLSKEESDMFFERFGAEVDKLEIGRHSNDLLGNLIYEAAMIGIAHWLARVRPDVLSSLLKPLLRATEGF